MQPRLLLLLRSGHRRRRQRHPARHRARAGPAEDPRRSDQESGGHGDQTGNRWGKIWYHGTIWLFNVANWEDPPFLIGKSSCLSSINGPYSIAMLDNQRVKYRANMDIYEKKYGKIW